MVLCPLCRRHVKLAETSCPFCRAGLAIALSVGIAAAGCDSKRGQKQVYGGPPAPPPAHVAPPDAGKK
jgi:hypothetical protein